MNDPLCTLGIDLAAVARNYLFFVKQLKKGADCGAMVKADAYGLGAREVARALYAQNCRHFSRSEGVFAYSSSIHEACAIAASAAAWPDDCPAIRFRRFGSTPRFSAGGSTPEIWRIATSRVMSMSSTAVRT